MPAKGDKGNSKPHDFVAVPLDLPAGLHSVLRYISRVDGTSVPQVVSQMIANGIRARKATDPDIRTFANERT